MDITSNAQMLFALGTTSAFKYLKNMQTSIHYKARQRDQISLRHYHVVWKA
jgi:hypothetical protein